VDHRGGRSDARKAIISGVVGKVSVVGAGMKSHPGVAAKTFATLRDLGVEPAVVTTSAIKIACPVPTDEVEKAVRAPHEAFELA
jgi:aspartate kinase